MQSCGPLHMDEQRQDVQLEPAYSSSVPIRDVDLRTCRKQWTIGRCGERGSEISVLITRHDDDDHWVWSSGWDYMIRLYRKVPEKFLHLIFLVGFWVVYIVCVHMIKFKLNLVLMVLLLRIWEFFHTNRWFLTGVWVTASLLKSPGLFSVFWLISTMLLFW